MGNSATSDINPSATRWPPPQPGDVPMLWRDGAIDSLSPVDETDPKQHVVHHIQIDGERQPRCCFFIFQQHCNRGHPQLYHFFSEQKQAPSLPDGYYVWALFENIQNSNIVHLYAIRVEIASEIGANHSILSNNVLKHEKTKAALRFAGELKKTGTHVHFNFDSGTFMADTTLNERSAQYVQHGIGTLIADVKSVSHPPLNIHVNLWTESNNKFRRGADGRLFRNDELFFAKIDINTSLSQLKKFREQNNCRFWFFPADDVGAYKSFLKKHATLRKLRARLVLLERIVKSTKWPTVREIKTKQLLAAQRSYDAKEAELGSLPYAKSLEEFVEKITELRPPRSMHKPRR